MNKFKNNCKEIISLTLIFVAAALMIAADFVDIKFTGDKAFDDMLKDVILRLVTGGVFTAVIALIGARAMLIPKLRLLPKQLLWCLPCIFVVLANFPYSALISGAAQITRADLVWLFVLKCFAVGIMEETLFRGLVQPTVADFFKEKPYKNLLTVAITSAVFGLFHLLNLFAGANVGATLLQVGYSFLIGAMLSAVLLKTDNIWLCVILHALFNVGGNLVAETGSGRFQDTCFWILTAIAGVICLVYILDYLIKLDREKSDEKENADGE
ncbi:MAG TPA: hypothetical protein DD415_01760 [Clostridiales bacterium]|nr:hypothetical protein [Clostridiales bacterium]